MSSAFDRLKSALSDRYTIERELGSGGMARTAVGHQSGRQAGLAYGGMAVGGCGV